jgi:peptide/nickel transport system permease protein
MLHFVQGDMGVGQVNAVPVWKEFISRLPNTLLLSFSAITFASCIAIPTGIYAARHAGKFSDNVASTLTLVLMSMPNFWIGLLLILLFSSKLGWLPSQTSVPINLKSIIMPAITSSAILLGTATRQTRSSMLEVLRADYLRTARAKGVPERIVIRKHALGNAWIPILTVIGTALIISFVGAVVVETVFSWPGIGRMASTAIFQRDVTTITGVVTLISILCMLVQLIVDLLYALVDPRIRAKFFVKKKKKKEKAGRCPV